MYPLFNICACFFDARSPTGLFYGVVVEDLILIVELRAAPICFNCTSGLGQ
jgi:hypothetical protein